MKLSISDLDLFDKRVFIRVDFNVPLKDGAITDDTRIRASLPTIQYALAHDARVVLGSHLGRPKGKADPKLSLRPVADRLGHLLGQKVDFCPDSVGPVAERMARAVQPGRALVLENLRFHIEEEKNDPAFARQLAGLVDLYVNDAFGTAHRAHASTEGMTHFVPLAAAGLLTQLELDYLGKALEAPERPFVVILGGAKISDKIEVVENLLHKADALLIGGAMAYTFLRARGLATGTSLVEPEKIDEARALLDRAAGHSLMLPVDHVAAEGVRAGVPHKTLRVEDDAALDGWAGVDIGPQTVDRYASLIQPAKTVVWNGPMGVFEIDEFATGTLAIARAVAGCRGTAIVGGGDSIAALAKAGVTDKITHISTGGGASLEFLAGKHLPGVEALTTRSDA